MTHSYFLLFLADVSFQIFLDICNFDEILLVHSDTAHWANLFSLHQAGKNKVKLNENAGALAHPPATCPPSLF